MTDPTVSTGKSKRLSEVVREVKIAAAERQDVVVDMKEADRARLELLAEELVPIFDEVPDENEQFDFVISSGLQPRLWIDAVAHVQMGPDRRTYRFVRDTRQGRIVMAETGDMMRAADSVTHYIAERIVERQRFLETEQVRPETYVAPLQETKPAEKTLPAKAVTRGSRKGQETTRRRAPGRPSGFPAAGIWWFLFGAVVGAAALFITFRETLGPALGP
ncbi:MAG: hypothetical protein NXI27_07610 [Alphaproteobacteria bacterium]|nr:hypothetical protein [Alphaproteobacteria bacterium]